MHADQKRRQYDTIQGMVNALVALPETTEAFKEWDALLGVSAKARRLDQAARRRPTRAQLDAQRDATEAFESATAGRDLWDSGLIVDAAARVQHLGYHGPVDLSFHLVTRFVQVKAAAGGWPLPDAPAPDFTAPWEYDVKLSGSWPASYVLARLEELKAIALAQKKAAARHGRPAARDAEEWQRAGAWYFLCQIKRKTAASLARELHEGLGAEHARDEEDVCCEPCQRKVYRWLAKVRKLLEVKSP